MNEREELVPRRLAAVLMAVLCHGTFLCAVASMAVALATGMQLGLGTLTGWQADVANLLLVLQFPIVHSLLLGRRGHGVLQRLSPVGHGRTLAVSTFAWLASLQLLLAFWAWSPSGVVWLQPHGGGAVLHYAAFAAAWLLLQKALYDAGLPVQTGAAGWWALFRGRPVRFSPLPTHGLFSRCRQPIYLGFALVLLTAPCWSLDWLLLASGWCSYCVVGPRLKEARWNRLFGEQFRMYRATVPFLLPRFRR